MLILDDVRILVTTRDEGDQRHPAVTETGSSLLFGAVAERCTFVHQVHGARVVVVDRVEGPLEVDADAIVTAQASVPIGVLGADCSVIGLMSREGVIGVVHAGWRGLLAGVIERSVEQMHALGAHEIAAIVGPTIGPECYEFSRSDLAPLVARLGNVVQVVREDGSDAFDLVAGVTIALERAGVMNVSRLGGCTACDPSFFSWRAGRDDERHALVIWREPSRAGAT